MVSDFRQKLRGNAKQILRYQLTLVVALSLLVWSLFDAHHGSSFFLGGAIGVIANFSFAFRLFFHSGVRRSRQIFYSLYVGESLKLITTIALFILCLKCLNLAYGAFLVGYVMSHLCFYGGVLMAEPKRKIAQQIIVEQSV